MRITPFFVVLTILLLSTSSTFAQVAQFSANTQKVCVGDTVFFTDLTTGGPSSWVWTFGDGDSAFIQTPFHIYTTAGIYDVQLEVDGGASTELKTAFVEVVGLPQVSFSSDFNKGCDSLTVAFTDASIADTAIALWIYDFGDGSALDSTQNTTHTYDSVGFYSVRLTVIDSNACVSNLVVDSLINISSPLAEIILDPSVCSGQNVTLVNNSQGQNLTSIWYFLDENTSDTTQDLSSIAHVFSGVNDTIFSVKLVVTDSNSCQDSTIQNVFVSFPQAMLSVDTFLASCVPLQVNFSGLFSPNLFNWVLNTGDTNSISSSDSILDTSYVYTQPGSFVPTLTMLDTVGCSTTVELSDTIQILSSVGAISIVSSDTLTAAAQSSFEISGLDTLNYALWNYGDSSQIDSLGNLIVLHTYSTSGAYLVDVIAEDTSGCLVSAQKSVLVIASSVSDELSNYFSPNGDGVNDVFTLYTEDFKEILFSIYNRWGELVFQNSVSTPIIEWYGRDFDGSPVPTGTYYYTLEITSLSDELINKNGYISVIAD